MSGGAPSIHDWTKTRAPGAAPGLALGAMNFGKRASAAESEKILARAVERGVTLVDTANVYTDGKSEEIVGAFVKKHPGKLLVATKVGLDGFFRGSPEGLSQQAIFKACEASQKRLGLDVIDLYYLHAPDPNVPIEESLTAIGSLLEKGKIRAWGVSNYASWQIVEMMFFCDRAGVARPVIAQQLYNVLIRQLDLEYAKFAAKYGLHTTVYNALAGGLLSGRYHENASKSAETNAAGDPKPQVFEKGSRFDRNKMYLNRYWTDRFFDLVGSYKALAERHQMSLVELSYRFLADAHVVGSILVGPATVAQLDAALDAVATPLPEGARADIDLLHRAFMGTDATYAR